MKQLTEYRRVTQFLDHAFDLLNGQFFENALSKPVITIQSTPRAYGHVTCGKVWENINGERRHELNIGAGTLTRPVEEIMATMVHEMVHLYCIANGIQDTSRGNVYHNKHFRDEAEKRGLHIEHHPAYGWTITSPADDLIQFCIDNDLEEIRITRIDGYVPVEKPTTGKAPADVGEEPDAPAKPKQITYKYLCPSCGKSCRATSRLHLICMDCSVVMTEIVK